MANISSITIQQPVTAYAAAGDLIILRVNFSANVEYSSLIGLKLNTTPEKYATPLIPSGGPVSYIEFGYTVEAGVYTPSRELDVLTFEVNGGGYVRNASDHTTPANLTLVSVGASLDVDGVDPEFYLVDFSPEYIKVGDSLDVTVRSTELVSLPDATVEGRGAGIFDTDDETHIFYYTIDTLDAEGGPITLTVSGTDSAGNPGSSPIIIPVKIAKQNPGAPATPTPKESISASGYVAFTWNAATHPVLGADAIDHYVAEITYGGSLAVTHTTSGPNDRIADMIVTYGTGSSADECKCRVKAVDKVGRSSAWTAYSAASTIDTRKVVCTITTADPSVNTAFDLDISFKDVLGNALAVSLPTLAKISVTNASLGAVTAIDGTNANYRVRVTPRAIGYVVIKVLAGASKNAQGSPNDQSNILPVLYDTSRPTCQITGPTGVTNAALAYTVKFNKNVVGFDASKVTTTGTSNVSVSGRASIFTVTLTPEAGRPKTVTIKVADSEVQDPFGNSNRASNMLSASFDDVHPTVVSVSSLESASTIYGTGDKVRISVDFDKPVYVSAGAPPSIDFLIGTTARTALYSYGSGSQSLVFTYIAAATDPVGFISNGNLAISATKYIKDKAGNLAVATCAESIRSSNLKIDPSFNPPSPLVTGIHAQVSYSLTEGAIVSKLNEGLGVIRSGVGRGDDLKVDVVAAANEAWVPHIRSGFAYYQDRELYLFANKKTVTVNNYTSGAAIELAISGVPGYDNNKILSYGPIIITDGSNSYTQISSSMRVCGGLTDPAAIPGTHNYKFSVPGLPVELYRTSINEPMRKVPTPEAVQDSNEYYPSVEVEDVGGIPTLKYYATMAGSTTPYATYLYDDPTDYYAQHEIGIVDSNMQIRAMYRDVMDHVTYYPRVRIVQEGIYTEIDARPYIQGNVITLPESFTRTGGSTGTIKPGDRIGLKYWVNRSWRISGSKVYIMHAVSPNPNILVEYEGSTEPLYKTDPVPASSPSYVQLNPLKSGVRSGFLYAVDSDTVPATPKNIRLAISTSSPTIGSTVSKSEPVRVLAKVVDASGDPIAGVGMAFSSRGDVDFVRGAGNTDVIDIVPQSIGGVNITPIYVVPNYYLYGQQPPWIRPSDPRGGTQDYTMTFTGGHWTINWLTTRRPKQGDKLTFYFSPALGQMDPTLFVPASQVTDWKGEVVGIWRPELPCRAVIRAYRSQYATALDDPLYKMITMWQHSYADLATAAFSDSQIPQKVYLTLTKESTEPGTLVARAYVTDVTGAYPISASVYFQSQSSRFSRPYPNAVLTNSDGVAENNYHPSRDDIIWAYIISGGKEIVSNRLYIGGNY